MARERYSKKISPFVEERLPDFVKDQYPTFVGFLKKYYEWMEQEGNPVERTSSLLSFRDVDESPEEFLGYLQNEYLGSFPNEFVADKALIIKNIQEFYKTKGTVQSFKFLFRVLYAVDVDIFYPGEYILKLSTPLWQLDTTIKVSTYFGKEWEKTIGYMVVQEGSGATAVVDNIRQRYESGVLVTEIYLHDIAGTFNSTGRITGTFVESGITKTVFGEPLFSVVDNLSIIAGGTGYNTGDQVVFAGVCDGSGAKGYVSVVDSSGKIREVVLHEFGINYQTTPTVTVQSVSGTGASLTATINTTATYPGYYADSDGGFYSSEYVFQDSAYYQQYSYVIDVNVEDGVSVKNYKEAVKATVHPAGMKMYGQMTLNQSIDSGMGNSEIISTAVSTV